MTTLRYFEIIDVDAWLANRRDYCIAQGVTQYDGSTVVVFINQEPWAVLWPAVDTGGSLYAWLNAQDDGTRRDGPTGSDSRRYEVRWGSRLTATQVETRFERRMSGRRWVVDTWETVSERRWYTAQDVADMAVAQRQLFEADQRAAVRARALLRDVLTDAEWTAYQTDHVSIHPVSMRFILTAHCLCGSTTVVAQGA